MSEKIVFNRVLGLKFLYDNFPYLYNDNRIKLYFVSSKKELLDLEIDSTNFDTFVLKRSSNKKFISDIKFKDNRFFDTIDDLKTGSLEFDDIFDFCVECHKFKKGENYYSDRLVIAQFSTIHNTDNFDKINFIPSIVPGVNTRDNDAYLEIQFSYNYGNVFEIKRSNPKLIKKNGFDDYSISYLASRIHQVIEDVRERLLALRYYDDFQLILRVDSYLNLLPIDFRTPNAWIKTKRRVI